MKMTNEEMNEIMKLYKQGFTIIRISEMINIEVHRVKAKIHILLAKSRGCERKFNKNTKREIEKMFNAGIKRKEIYRKLGIDKSMGSKFIDELQELSIIKQLNKDAIQNANSNKLMNIEKRKRIDEMRLKILQEDMERYRNRGSNAEVNRLRRKLHINDKIVFGGKRYKILGKYSHFLLAERKGYKVGINYFDMLRGENKCNE